MSPFLKKKKETEVVTTHDCNCELCKFSEKVDELFDTETRQLVSPFVRSPSHISKIDPEKSLEQARKYEGEGKIHDAT